MIGSGREYCALLLLREDPMNPGLACTFENSGFQFEWNWMEDRAVLRDGQTGACIWSGSLLPAFRLKDGCGEGAFVKARVRAVSGGELELDFPGWAAGRLAVEKTGFGMAFRRLEVEWAESPPPLLGLYFGVSELDERERTAAPEAGAIFWPDWRAEGFCVPGAKGNPGQSFWRFWDMGHAVLPLGSFGPAMGTPYTAAFPRPLLAAAMGSNAGWMVFGPGSVPAAALSLDIKSSSAWLRFWMREDLWGAHPERRRTWDEPLRLTWHKSAWDGFARLFGTFPCPPPAKPSAQRSQWGTWGNFKDNTFDLDAERARALAYGAEDFEIDDKWETWNSSGILDAARLPRFHEQIALAREQGLRIGLWQSIGWVDKPEEAGLTAEDLLCGPDGKPRLSHWGCDPRSDQPLHYCLDPSSERARRFLIERTRRQMREIRPGLYKLDFGYGLPGPDAAAPRNPELRGERLCLELLRLVVETAREENPDVAIEYYGIHPLMRPHYDFLSLDDLGDMGVHEVDGHHQRSVWGALVGRQGAAIMAASGYYWLAFEEMLLNAAILGAPGGCLPERDTEGGFATPSRICRFRALSRWYRRSIGWEPLWLNSHKGDLAREPALRCWGRLEDGRLTALALREDENAPDLSRWGIRNWTGRWAIIVQDGEDLAASKKIACIPFDPGRLDWDSRNFRIRRVTFSQNEECGEPMEKTAILEVKEAAQLDSLMGFLVEAAGEDRGRI